MAIFEVYSVSNDGKYIVHDKINAAYIAWYEGHVALFAWNETHSETGIVHVLPENCGYKKV